MALQQVNVEGKATETVLGSKWQVITYRSTANGTATRDDSFNI